MRTAVLIIGAALGFLPVPSAAFLSVDSVRDSILAEVAACHSLGVDERIEVTELPSLASFELEATERVVELLPPHDACKVGRVTWRARVSDPIRTVVKPLGVEVRRLVKALALSEDAPRGTAITAALLDTVWVDVTYNRTPLLRSLQDRDDLSLTRRALAGTVLTETLVEATPVIRRGDLVVVVHEGPGFRVTVEGEAREDGTVGEEITIKNVESGESFTAVVEGPGRCRR
jgi:flagella basal body P-ring formation protein FlgA